jgi:hypothetical protein
MNVYLDTNLWNELLNQNIDPPSLHAALSQRGKQLALGDQTIYELARTFAVNHQKGQELFRYIKQFADTGITVTLDIQELLHREAKAHGQPIEPFAIGAEYQAFLAEIDKLAAGIVDATVQQDAALRQQSVPTNRNAQKTHLVNRPDKQSDFLLIDEGQLEDWMASIMQKIDGAAILTGQLIKMLGIPDVLAVLCAQKLISLPSTRIAKGLVRADLYFNWRGAHMGSIKQDLQHDMHHVLSSSYCDVYATKEANQARYAHLLLTPATRVCIYENKIPIDDWLLALN